MPRRPITRAHPYTPKSGAFVGKTFRSERQYRNALARQKGFRSWRAQRRVPAPVYTEKRLAALRPSARQARDRALHALSLMRREKLSLAQAARRENTTPETVWKYAAPALLRTRGGRIGAKPADRFLRHLPIATADGLKKDVRIRGSRTASLIGEYWNAVGVFRDTGEEEPLRKFTDFFPAGVRVLTDPTAIEALARRGELDFEDNYDLTD